MMISRKHILLMTGLLLPSPLQAEDAAIAGMYDDVPLAYDAKTGMISGAFNEETGAGQFSCIFYFSGKLQGREAKITSYFPGTPNDKIEGVVSLSDAPKPELKISLKEEHGGCWNVAHFADTDPASFTLDTAHPSWQAIDVVKSKKAYFYPKPSATSRLSSYVVQGDAVAITGEQGDWVQVDYQGEKLISGYLRKADLYRLH